MRKKDLNYIAALEKAISKKYGDIAIINPKDNWDEEKEQKYEKEARKLYKKHTVISGNSKLFKKTERICPKCGEYSFSIDDDLYMNKFDCCYRCYIKYIEDRD